MKNLAKYIQAESLARWARTVTKAATNLSWPVTAKPMRSLFGEPKILRRMPGEERPTPEILDMNIIKRASHLQKNTVASPEALCVLIENALYSPDLELVLSESPRQILAEGISTAKTWPVPLRRLYEKEIVDLPGTCSVFRSRRNVYYHTLIDNTPRVSMLAVPEFDGEQIKLLHGSPLNAAEDHLISRLAPSGLKTTQLEKGGLYRVERLMLPTFLTQRYCGLLPSWYLELLMAQVAPARRSRRNRRILISRPPHLARGKRILNEDELSAFLAPLGFERIVLEEMPFEEQLELFYDAEVVVGAHGAGLANTIFSRDIGVLELFPTPKVYPHYYFLGRNLGHTYRHLCAPNRGRNSNFVIDLAQVKPAINELVEQSGR